MNDSVTLVDLEDNPIGSISKLDAHLRSNLEGENKIGPHRAFSLILLNSNNEILLQQRSEKKITFPGLWTNTCCSHPAHILEELDSNQENEYLGIRKATIRRSKFELGISNDQLNINDLVVGSRILYKANACNNFAEYELDYIVFAKKDVDINPNPDEIKQVQYVKINQIFEFLNERKQNYNEDITPWFNLLLQKSQLIQWLQNIIIHDFKNGVPRESQNILRF